MRNSRHFFRLLSSNNSKLDNCLNISNVDFAFLFGYALVIAFGLDQKSPVALGWSCAIVAVCALFSWVYVSLRIKEVSSYPSAAIASAPQGYVELKGVGRRVSEEELLFSPRLGTPCLWYRHAVYSKRSGESSTKTMGVSFLLDDGTGICLVDLTGAAVLVKHKNSWKEHGNDNVEWVIPEGETICLLGEFKTLTNLNEGYDSKAEMKVLLDEWKKNKKQLLERFDLDGDGQIDLKEWTLARRAARREVERRRHEEIRQPVEQIHTMSCPVDGRAYLVSTIDLIKRLQIMSVVHLAVFFSGTGGVLILSGMR